MNSYFDSSGNKYTQSQIDYRIRKAAREYLETQYLEHGYNFCEACMRSDGRKDVAHIVSRKKAKEMRKVHWSWDFDNLIILCRSCHQDYDKLNLQFT